MKFYKTIYNISMALAFAMALAFTSCTTDDDGDSPTTENTSPKGLYLQPLIASNTVGQTTRADEVASSYNLQESKISEMYLAIGLEWNKGDNTKTGQYYIFRKKGIDISAEGNVLMVEGKSWRETIKEACGYNVAVPVDVYVIANPRESFDATAGLDKVVSDLTKMKTYLQTPQEEKTEQGDNPIYQIYDATSNPNKNFLMYGHTRWTPNATGDTATIRVNLNRVAAKIVANVVVNSSNYELVEDDTHTPSCTLTNYTNSALPTEDFQYTVETETKTTTDGVTTWEYSEEVVKEKLTAKEKIAVETTPVSVTMKQSEGVTGYEITTYSYPFSWADNSNNSPELDVKFYIKEKNGTEITEKTATIPVTNTNVTALERNHIYTVNYVLNLLGSDVSVTYPSSVNYNVQTWTEETVNGVDEVETTYTIEKEVAAGNADITFDGFEWTNPVLCDGNQTEASKSSAFDSNDKTKTNKGNKDFVGSLNSNLYIKLNESKNGITDGLTIDPGGNEGKDDEGNDNWLTFYVKDTKSDGTVIWYKFTIKWVSNPSSGTTTEETTPTISAESAINAIGTDGYYYVDLSKISVTDYVIAQPTSTSYDVVSPAFVINASSTSTASLIDNSVGSNVTANGYTGWRLPTVSELALINSLNSDIVSSDKSYFAINGDLYTSTSLYKGDGTSSSETTGYIIAIHDLTANELQALE